ncbi:MAG TPA: FAD-binding oxidoreductase [Micromonosporaceae bacterium]|nr:FAD-binding oxidoreductase [Micromonosporaceae bacterium]HCU52472.1 FAD-binding oxidoreductase [Micromonosporaceae bacterium]
MNRHFEGAVYLPGDDGYEAHRRPLRADLDPHPAIVIEALSASDIRIAIAAARERQMPFAVQATGHGTHVACDGGILVKTSAMTRVLVDPDRRIARVGPGTRWSDVLAAATPFGLAPLSGSSPSVGVTGYTLGGGVGWLSRKFGFAADNVLRAQVVTADGRLLMASPDQHPDLFWALRGGGGNFGVVTSLEFQLHPVAQVYAGSASFAVDSAAKTVALYRDWAANAPDEMSTAIVLRQTPDGTRELVIKAMYTGDADVARKLLAPLWTVAGPALREDFRSMPYAEAAMGGTAARYLDLFRELPDPMIDVLIAAHEQTGSTVEIRHWGGAMANPGPNAGPVGHRDVPFSVILDAPTPQLAQSLQPYGIGGSFLNFLGDTTKTHTAFTPANYARLQEVKASYDPENLFRINHNIAPSRIERRGVEVGRVLHRRGHLVAGRS